MSQPTDADAAAGQVTPDAVRADMSTVVQRIRGQGERLHVPLGQDCNNNCLFCMEDDRELRRAVNSGMDEDRVRWILQQHAGAEEVCFTSGEPTQHPHLAKFVRAARQAGFPRVSVMTNGRRLSYAPYLKSLAAAGLNRVYVSIHGHQASLHDRMTRTPGSFAQTVAGIRAVAALKPLGVTLHTSTVVTRRNVDLMLEIYEYLVGSGVDQAVFNAIQVIGRAARLVDPLVPRYTAVCEGFRRLVGQAPDAGAKAFLVDVPMCVLQRVPDGNRGWFERHVHYEVPAPWQGPDVVAPTESIRCVRTEDIDRHFRRYGADCASCAYRPVCPGVFAAYAEKFGWDEFVPVQKS